MQRRLAPYGAIAVLDADLEAPEPWFTMPLAERSFRTQVASDRVAGTVTAEPLIAILDALEQVHRLGYVHRDLKPENILFCEGAWRLADFGLVAVPHGDASTRLTSTTTGWATVLYCAPEQAIDFKNVDKSADIYAMGCILHDIVGVRPRVPVSKMHAAEGAHRRRDQPLHADQIRASASRASPRSAPPSSTRLVAPARPSA